MTWSIYDPESGIITSRVNNQNQIIGRPAVAGNYQPGQWYVVKDAVIALPNKPPAQPQVVHIWDLASRSWQIDPIRTEFEARRMRQSMFVYVDKVNPMWFASMSPDQQAAVTAYRQALLDITDQPGYPEVIDWPLKPAWL